MKSNLCIFHVDQGIVCVFGDHTTQCVDWLVILRHQRTIISWSANKNFSIWKLDLLWARPWFILGLSATTSLVFFSVHTMWTYVITKNHGCAMVFYKGWENNKLGMVVLHDHKYA